uniref:Uncharacterized protein n=1 Tax=Arundo donax TaxID=35708 RepID=A0A0A9FW16_ARUDO
MPSSIILVNAAASSAQQGDFHNIL